MCDWGVFDDADQASQHIRFRYVQHGNRMLMVSNLIATEPVATVVCTDKLGNRLDLLITDPLFNSFRFHPFGWANTELGAGAIWAELRPVRQTKRGYGAENIGLFSVSKYNQSILERNVEDDVGSFLYSDGVNELLANDYPTFEEAFDFIQTPDVCLAIGRKYLLQSDENQYGWLWRRDTRIGMVLNPWAVRLGALYKQYKEELLGDMPFLNVE